MTNPHDYFLLSGLFAFSRFASVALTLTACTPSMSQMRDRFQLDVSHAIGFTVAQLQSGRFQFIGHRQPTDQKVLANGNTEYVYGDYWVQYGIARIPCTVFFEINLRTRIVVAARSEGDGCYMPY